MPLTSNFILFLSQLTYTLTLPIDKINASRSDIIHKELLPPDHVPGAHMEQDGHINKEYHHEVFLGNLMKDGSLDWDNMKSYKKLIGIFHKVDINEDHRVNADELSLWIHDRILEHFQSAVNESNLIFLKVDHNKDEHVSWPEYKAQLLGLDPKKYEHDNITIEVDKSGEFSKEVKHWLSADINHDHILSRQEFVTFLHPEHNQKTIEVMANEMLVSYDKNKDRKISLKEFIKLPDGEVDPEDAYLDVEYQKMRSEEFRNDIDFDEDNFATMKELVKYLDPRNLQHAVKEAEYLIKNSDRNRDGKISEHEMLMQYHLFTGSSFSNYAQVLHDEF